MSKLASLVSLSPGFKTAVNVIANLDDDAKTSAYIPTEVACDIIEDMADGLHPLSGRRSRLLTGTYGTGKSHLALVLARLYRDGTEDKALSPVLTKLGKWPGRLEKLRGERGRLPGKFLLVLLEGDEGSFNDSLLRRLDMALISAGLQDLLPETAFDAALARIAELRSQHPRDLKRLEDTARGYGFESLSMLEAQLAGKQRQAYDRFCELHKAVFAGAPFYQHHMISPKDVYSAVARRLVEDAGYEGIVVIWDEFGRYMERVVDDPRGLEGQSIQTFADGCCNKSGKYPVHLYLICHRSLPEYARISALARASGMSKEDQDEWAKIKGRFTVFHMTTSDQEVYELIDRVVVQAEGNPEWQARVTGWRDFFDECAEESLRLNLFRGLSREQVMDTIVLGAYPLHPMTSFCLPKLSEKVAQNERTLFTFLSDSGKDSLGPFLASTDLPPAEGRPEFLTADRLWDYFAGEVEEHPVHRRVLVKLSQANAQVPPDNELAKRALKAMAVLQVVNSELAPCTEEVLAFALGLSAGERSRLREELKGLCSKSADHGRVLVQNVADGHYRFGASASDQELDAKVNALVEQRFNSVSPLQHLRRIALRVPEILPSIPATGYFDDFMVNREFTLELTNSSELQAPERWLQNLGDGRFIDGYALVALCEDGQALREARERAMSITHPQILIGIPKEPVEVSHLLRRHEALQYLESTEAALFGPGGVLRDEWEQQEKDLIAAISMVVGPLFEPEKGLLNWYNRGKQAPPVLSVSALRGWASRVMEEVFPLTPRISHDKLTSEEGKDSFVSCRQEIVNTLLRADGPELLAKEGRARDKMVIQAVYIATGILRRQGTSWVVARPDGDEHLATNKVWSEIDARLLSARDKPLAVWDLLRTLRSSPFGLRPRVIPLLFAAVAREYIQRGNLSLEYDGGRSVARLDGKAIDDALLVAPRRCSLVFTDIGETQEAILVGVAIAFGIDPSLVSDRSALVEQIHKRARSWWHGLSAFCQETQLIPKDTLAVRDSLFRPLAADDADARRLLLEELPRRVRTSAEGAVISSQHLGELIARHLGVVQGAVETHLIPAVEKVVVDVFGGGQAGEAGWTHALATWYNSLNPACRNKHLPGDPAVVLRIARQLVEGPQAQADLAGFVFSITGAKIGDWDDKMLDRFGGRLEGARKAIEAGGGGDPEPGRVHVEIRTDQGVFSRTFVPVQTLSPMAENLRAILGGAISGIGRTLPAGECETVVIEVLRGLLE